MSTYTFFLSTDFGYLSVEPILADQDGFRTSQSNRNKIDDIRNVNSQLFIHTNKQHNEKFIFYVDSPLVSSGKCTIYVCVEGIKYYIHKKSDRIILNQEPFEWELIYSHKLDKMGFVAGPSDHTSDLKNWLYPNNYDYIHFFKFEPWTCRDSFGIVHWGRSYKFTDKNYLLEGSKTIKNMGMKNIKIYLGSKSARNYELNIDTNSTLANIAKCKEYKKVFKYDFKIITIVCHSILKDKNGKSLKSTYWKNADSSAIDSFFKQDYQQIYDLTIELSKYKNTKFILSNWEGDWMTRERTDDVYARMIKWIQMRQKAVNDAKKQYNINNVYLALEVNHVLEAAKFFHSNSTNMSGSRELTYPSVTTKVLTNVKVDYVLYSCYDCSREEEFELAISFLKKINKNIIIGEFGIPAKLCSDENFNSYFTGMFNVCNRHLIEVIYYWQLYDNEYDIDSDGNKHYRGFGLIDKDGKLNSAYMYLKFNGGGGVNGNKLDITNNFNGYNGSSV
jgi:hypothetical protein